VLCHSGASTRVAGGGSVSRGEANAACSGREGFGNDTRRVSGLMRSFVGETTDKRLFCVEGGYLTIAFYLLRQGCGEKNLTISIKHKRCHAEEK